MGCKVCGYDLAPGEGKNGVCDYCLEWQRNVTPVPRPDEVKQERPPRSKRTKRA